LLVKIFRQAAREFEDYILDGPKTKIIAGPSFKIRLG
jgi:hypothetical protein